MPLEGTCIFPLYFGENGRLKRDRGKEVGRLELFFTKGVIAGYEYSPSSSKRCGERLEGAIREYNRLARAFSIDYSGRASAILLENNRCIAEKIGHEYFIDVTLLKEDGKEMGLLYALVLASLVLHGLGLSLREICSKILHVYSKIGEARRRELRSILSRKEVDWGNNLLTFLERGSKSEGYERERWVSWILSCSGREYPYDVARTRRILEEYGDAKYGSECRLELYRALRETYREDIDAENVRYLAESARRAGMDLVYMRLGRASMVMGYVLASSRCCEVTDSLKRSVEDLVDFLEDLGGRAYYRALIFKARLLNRYIPDAQLIRLERSVLKALGDYLRGSEEELWREAPEDGERRLGVLRGLHEKILGAYEILLKVRKEARGSGSKRGAFVFFGQRLSPIGASKVAYVNEVMKAFAGPSFGLEKYILEGSPQVYATPSLEALKYVDYWVEALPLFIHETGDGRYEIDYENMESAIRSMAPYWAENIALAEKEGRKRPTFIVVTTQSYNMTSLVRFWLEEEMANYNVVKAFGLEGEVEELALSYRERIVSCAEKIVEEQRLEEAVRVEMGRGLSRERALMSMISKDPAFSREVAKLCLIEEHGLEGEASRLMAQGVPPGEARERVLESYKLEKDFSLSRTSAREESLAGEIDRYIYRRIYLSRSTARKEVIARHGLQEKVKDYWFSATEPGKRYNLVYAPSRVDLGPREIDSVIALGQQLGPFDEEAGAAARELFEKINVSEEGVHAYINPPHAEGQKTLENASRDDNYAFANLVALSSEAMDANAYSMIANINFRPTHLILWPGRGYGGFCVPKDGLFVSYVLSLRDSEVLEKIGIPSHLHGLVRDLANRILESRVEHEDPLEWLEESYSLLRPVLEGASAKSIYLGSLPQALQVLEKLGQPRDEWAEYLRTASRELYERRYLPSRAVNIFMAYHAAALIGHAVDLARKHGRTDKRLEECSVGIQASYKPGVQDSRLTTEFDVFLGLTHSGRRLKRLRWGWLQDLISRGVGRYGVPREVRVIDPLIDRDSWLFDGELTLRKLASEVKLALLDNIEGFGEDDILLNIESFGNNFLEWIVGVKEGGGLIKVKDRPRAVIELIREDLRELGLTDGEIDRSLEEYGLNFGQWPGLRGAEDVERVIENKIRGRITWLITYYKGFYEDPVAGVRGLDVLSLGVPHPSIVQLAYDQARLYYLMRDGNPDSALAIVDGTAGARGPVWDRDMAKMWLAFRGTYVSIGISDAVIDEWRREVERERELAEALLRSIMDGRYEEAQELLNRISAELRNGKLDRYYRLYSGVELGDDPRTYSDYGKRYGLLLEVLSRMAEGLNVADLDFGTFLLIGGRYVIAGNAGKIPTYEEFRDYVAGLREKFEERIGRAPPDLRHAPPMRGLLPKEKVDEIVATFLLREGRIARMERVLGGSLKGETREEWEVMQLRMIRRRQRRARIISSLAGRSLDKDLDSIYGEARRLMEENVSGFSDQSYSEFLVLLASAIRAITREIAGAEESLKIYREVAERVLKVGGLTIDEHRRLVDHLSRLAFRVQGQKERIERIALVAELLDSALAVELTSDASSWREMWTAIARFFDRTLNNHIFDYAPYLYTRAAFSKDREFRDLFTRREMFELVARRHEWLYRYLRGLMEERTELKLWDREDVERLMTWGVDGDDIAARDGYAEASRFVFSYARLRDLATLYHDGFYLPEVLDGVDPEAIRASERVNVVLMYNLGNTTAMVFLRRAPYHHSGRGPDKNIVMTNFLRKGRDPASGREVALVDYGFMYLTREEYEKAGGKNKIASYILDPVLRERYRSVGPEGRFVFVRFKRPIVAHVVFPHFTHPWFKGQVLEDMGVPVSQSRIIDRVTYMKTVLPEMIEYYNSLVEERERVPLVDQVNIYREDLRDKAEGERRRIVEEILYDFSLRHPKVIIKTSTESGGRGTIVALLRRPDGTKNLERARGIDGSVEVHNFDDAVRFIVEDILPRDDAVVQEFIESRPREILTDKALGEVIKRFEKLGISVRDDTKLYWNFRNYVTQAPGGEPEITGRIMLIHVKSIANFGQGGQLFVLEREMFREEYRHLVDEMERISKATMKMMELYAPILAERLGIRVGRDATGTPYSFPMTNLSDLMLKPIYEDGKLVDWIVVPIEENIGMGLFYPYERELERRGRAGESVDPILRNLALVGLRYKRLLESGKGAR